MTRFEKFYNGFGEYAEQRELNFSHAFAAAGIVVLAVLQHVFG